ncbi:MAG TPA: M48 family metallopeptidase [Candidatus Binatia bacterium]|nr:M48 family metallopeptidase [Candidatus Binatia bacterium]
MRTSAVLVFFFLIFFLLVGLSVDYVYLGVSTPAGLLFPIATATALLFALFLTLTAYGYGDSLILASVGAEKLDIRIPEHRELHNLVTEMALASGCPMPKVYVVYDAAPNAFATGRRAESAAICVTTGLLAVLNRQETQGVVAHEMAHIKNRDILLMMLVSVLFGGIALLSDWSRRALFRPHGRRAGGSLLIALPALLLVMFSPLISRLLAVAVSRQREYLADATAVEFTRNPLGLAQALEKIRDAKMPFQKASQGTAHLFIASPFHRRFDERDGKLSDLLSTHPPINRRILLLYQMAGVRPRAEAVDVSRLESISLAAR